MVLPLSWYVFGRIEIIEKAEGTVNISFNALYISGSVEWLAHQANATVLEIPIYRLSNKRRSVPTVRVT